MYNLSDTVIVTGHYGSGKTNIAVNLAMNFAGIGEKVCIIDLDIVNPYFRSADFEKLFMKNGIKLIAPGFANTNLDIPSLCFDIQAVLDNYDRIIIDVGGDDQGALALGQYAESLSARGYDMLYVVNKYRYLTNTAEEAVELMGNIERAAGLKVKGIINCSNLGLNTTAYDIEDSIAFAEQCAKEAGIPMLFTAAMRGLDIKYAYPVEIYIRPFWEEHNI